MATNEARRAATREKLILAARAHFAKHGFEETHTDSILEEAGVSRGAMYHHYASKKELFEAVFITVSDETIAHAQHSASRTDSPLNDLKNACLAWLRSVKRREVAAILLDQGPQVLGWKRARELEAKSSLAPMKLSLRKAVAAGELDVPSVDLTARLINAVLAEIALATVHRDPAVSVAKQEATLDQVLNGFRTQSTDR